MKPGKLMEIIRVKRRYAWKRCFCEF